MRKLLLATAAMLGAASGIASAQAPAGYQSQGQVALPSPGGYAAANTANNTNEIQPGYVGAKWGGPRPPDPGTVVIKLYGRVQVQAETFWTTGNVSPASSTAAVAAKAGTFITVGGVSQQSALATAAVPASTTPAGKYKLQPFGMTSYVRLYPGVDGMTPNGLRYGASVELRTNYYAGASSANVANSPSTNSDLSTIFMRRSFIYFAADNLGLIRVGETDGIGDLFDPGTYTQQSFDSGVGMFNGAMLQGVGPTGSVAVPYSWFRDASSDYNAVKVVYLSPQFFGLDFGLEYTPSMGDLNQNQKNLLEATTIAGVTSCAQANPQCISLTTGDDGTRWYNKVAGGMRWQGEFGPVKAGIYGIYTTASKEHIFGTVGTNKAGPKSVGTTTFDRLSEFDVAGGISYDSPIGTFALSANYAGGVGNGGAYVLRPSGGAPLDAIIGAITYKNGPFIVGVAVEQVNSQGAGGALVGVSQRREQGFAISGQYTIAPGVTMALEYMYLQRHQTGFDFVTNAAGVGGLTRDGRAQGLMFATGVNW